VDPSSALGSVFAAFGLSGAAGLNAWLPLFTGALLDRLGVVDLAEPFDQFSTTTGLVVLGTLLVLDFAGDKIPAVDHALHVAGTVIAPLSGAALFTGSADAHTDIPTIVTVLTGGAVAGAIHLARAALRAASTATTATLVNPVLSLGEDATSGVLTAIAFLAPILAVVAVGVMAVAGFAAWRARRAGAPSPSG
jgi:hypothetical protein